MGMGHNVRLNLFVQSDEQYLLELQDWSSVNTLLPALFDLAQ